MTDRVTEEDDAGEEEGPDWRMLSRYTKSLGARSTGTCIEPFIPKRGEKDFEPIEALAPSQSKALDESRQALFTALSAGLRGHSSRDHVRCVWPGRGGNGDTLPARPYVDGTVKGVMFTSLGRWNKGRKRLELMPEELLYLIERGTVQCWTSDKLEGRGSIPMSVQWAWTELIGYQGLSLERYQVYAYLKRLGYTVLRKEHVDSIWTIQTAQTKSLPVFRTSSLFARSLSFLYTLVADVGYLLKRLVAPVCHSSKHPGLVQLTHATRCLALPGSWTNYALVFNSLRMIPSGSKVPLPATAFSSQPPRSPQDYEVFYYVYKPNNRFPKTSPPAPDFQICVVDAQQMSIPTIALTSRLLDTVSGPEEPLYPSKDTNKRNSSVTDPQRPHVFQFISSFFTSGLAKKTIKPKRPFRQNIFAKLKKGERDVLLAVVDYGIISFLVSSLQSSITTG